MLPLSMFGLLLFSLLPYGADLTCTPMLNSLSIEAPEIIEMGTELTANCSTTEENFEELSLCLGNKCCKNSPNNSVVSCVVPVLDSEMKTECKIKLNDTECSKEFEIIIYKTPQVTLSVKNPSDMQADYELNCHVFEAIPTQNLSVTWYKNDTLLKVEPFMDFHRGVENISYIMMVNISREEKFAEFRCEAQLNLGQQEPQYLVISTKHSLSARYAPELRINSTQNITVVKGGNATLVCDVEANPPAKYNWTVNKQPWLETTNRLEINQVYSWSAYSCTATNALGNITIQFYLDVEEETATTDRPTETMASPEAKAPENCGLTVTPKKVYVKYGESVSINCSTTIKDVDKMSWEAAVGNRTDTPPTVTWKVDKLEYFTMEPKCFVTLNDGNQCILKADIILYKLPDYLAVSAVGNGSMTEGEKHQLQCDMHGVAPANNLLVKWYKENTPIEDGQRSLKKLTECFSDSFPKICNVSSVYSFTAEKSDNRALFRCEAMFDFEPTGPQATPSMSSQPYRALVHYKPTIKNCSASYAGLESSFGLINLTCEWDGNPAPAVKWEFKSSPTDPNKLLNRTDSGTYKATAYNSLGQVDTDVHITVEYVPSFSCQMQYDLIVNNASKTFCKPDGLPSPSISWFKNGNEIFPQSWKKNESGNYLLKASNKHGTAEHRFYLNILYPPEFTESDITKEFTADANVSLVWEADGNPEPEIQCTYQSAENVQVTTVGRQKIITITGATSTNVGPYICAATNKIGNVTRTTTLVLQDKNNGLIKFWWIILLGLLLCAILLLFLILNKINKRGGYSFVASNGKSNIPLQSNFIIENGKTTSES